MASPAARRLTPEVTRRRRLQRRRRDVLGALLLGAVATLVLAFAGLRAMVYLQLLFDAAVASYVALLVRLRSLAAERDLKLAYLPANQAVQATQIGGRRAASGYDLGFQQAAR